MASPANQGIKLTGRQCIFSVHHQQMLLPPCRSAPVLVAPPPRLRSSGGRAPTAPGASWPSTAAIRSAADRRAKRRDAPARLVETVRNLTLQEQCQDKCCLDAQCLPRQWPDRPGQIRRRRFEKGFGFFSQAQVEVGQKVGAMGCEKGPPRRRGVGHKYTWRPSAPTGQRNGAWL